MTTHSGNTGSSQTMKASEFKAKCLGLMDEVAEHGGEIVITKNGKPVARLTAYHERPKTLFGIDKGRLKITGDIISPIDVEWEAESDPDRVLNP
ncbi:MAG: type II toxin-antitoxin system prevent-host-death family antitoxin [Chloroflexi bacterium]|nr:type II toxin-antitoxin system prevent-host-death family antitoxin [Chloroflexota bacterium]